jgi:hypothetical protein
VASAALRPTSNTVISLPSGAGFNLAGKLKTNSRLVKMLGTGIAAIMQMSCQWFPSLGNLFAFAVLKPLPGQGLQPWLKPVNGGIGLDSDWFRRRRFPTPEKADAAVFHPLPPSKGASLS